jgi:pyruvate dehydrogenase E2 component (dihydrolipoamide acetyltransferase)
MSQEVFLLPDVGEGLIEAEIVSWKVAVGDTVVLNQPLCDVETAKATVELPSPYAGVVVALHGNPGDMMEVHKPLITFEVGGDGSAPAPAAPVASAPAPALEEPKVSNSTEGREAVLVGYGVANEDGLATRKNRRSSAPVAPVAAAAAPLTSGPVRTTPPVRLLAKQKGLDLATVPGTGREGIITRADVERALQGGGTAVAAAPRKESAPKTGPLQATRFVGNDLAPWSTGPKEERIPAKGVLKAMAEAMGLSKTTIPHAGVWLKVDATKTMELIAGLKQQPSLEGVRISPLTIIALAVTDAARHFPGINSHWDDVTKEAVIKRSMNLGIAADTNKGLIVPNIKEADKLDLVGMAQELNVLVDKVRAGTTSLAEMSGTSFTITNVGPMGVDAAMAIIPPGSGAILAVGQVAKAPWVANDEIVVRQVVELCLSFDHRMIDGALASKVLAHIGKFLNDPAAAIIAG